ncbi:hypothetical protein [Sulfurimonas sp.]|uniref:hypothetical protein n=1 Tax=Sulfurimonas sp. TaxID=2022749 RepID=UPI0019DEEEE0|nr:hypothetical protein [Sulfurimonas sp.]MBE0515201.1 hypothetical protein [Sulfurimonas sp.]
MDECLDIDESVRLMYYEYRLQHLVGQEVANIFSLDHLLTIIALLFSAGAIMVAFAQSFSSGNNAPLVYGMNPAVLIVSLILTAVLIYTLVVNHKYNANEHKLSTMITSTQKKITEYKKRLEK